MNDRPSTGMHFLYPKSCDTFVVMNDETLKNENIFAKNSDRPDGEIQEIIYEERRKYSENIKLKCTYIEIDQVPETCSVILSKPFWTWGAEMGANEHGVCIGNEAIWTKIDIDSTERLLGMDIVRLGLERSRSAQEALDIICALLEKYGQGGACSYTNKNFSYHNSFMIVDSKEAWVLETAGKFWAAEKITKGHRNISNGLTIGTKIDAMSKDLKMKLKDLSLWDGISQFDFRKCLSDTDSVEPRQTSGENILNSLTAKGEFTLRHMFNGVLRDSKSNICRGMDDDFPSVGSMVCTIESDTSKRPNCCWLTGTPDPRLSVFKPFIFTPNVEISNHTQCQEKDKAHLLYSRQQAATKIANPQLVKSLRELELKYVKETENFLDNFAADRLPEVKELLKDCVESELKMY